MSKDKSLINIFPELINFEEIPLILHNVETLSKTLVDEAGNYVEIEEGIDSVIIEAYNSINCRLNYLPGKPISRLFE